MCVCVCMCLNYVSPAMMGQQGDRSIQYACQEHLRAAMKHDLTSAFGQYDHQVTSTALTEYYIQHSATHCTRGGALEDIRSILDKEATTKNQQEYGIHGNLLINLVNSLATIITAFSRLWL